jgi:hypothetical protein
MVVQVVMVDGPSIIGAVLLWWRSTIVMVEGAI